MIIRVEFEPLTPVYITHYKESHAQKIKKNHLFIATVISCNRNTYLIRFKDGKTASIESHFLEQAFKGESDNAAGWIEHESYVLEVKSQKLINASRELSSLCKKYGVLLSVKAGEVILVDSDNVDKNLVIDSTCHL